MNVHVKTYGCQMNERDSEAVRALLRRHGHAVSADEAAADVVIVNTCSVRGKAEAKALGKLGLLVAGGRGVCPPRRRVGAVGCMVQRLGAGLMEKVPGLDFALGTHRLHTLPAVLDMVEAGRGPVLDVSEERAADGALNGHEDGAVSSFVNILLGCDRRCSYCIVPAVRGREWSRPAASVLEEIGALASAGVRDVTLLGQSVMAYGRSNEAWPQAEPSAHGYREALPRLLEAAGAVPGVARLRFTSGHPSGCTDELARAMAEVPAVCEHLHLPMQSGADRVLRRMRRGYTADDYRAAVARLRRRVPGLALTTDVIVGFPGETEPEFEATRRLMEEIGFDNAFVFKYSPRPGTRAADLDDDVTEEEKRRRNQVLLDDQQRRGLRINRQLVGSRAEVLVEGVSPRNARRWTGRTRTNKIVLFEPCRGLAAGDLVRVSIERAREQTLYGRPVVDGAAAAAAAAAETEGGAGR
jgi:tRNA-2-methylthio-N6-dimethylallyladenosine synthase